MQNRPPRPSFAGILRGLDKALGDWLYRLTSQASQCELSKECMVTFPILDWHLYPWVEQGATASIPAGSVTPVTVYTVPRDRRGRLTHLHLLRTSGDNTISFANVFQAAGYGTGNRSLSLGALVTPGTSLFWPTQGQVAQAWGPLFPVLLEPGSTVTFTPTGAGISASLVDYYVALELTPMIRSRAP